MANSYQGQPRDNLRQLPPFGIPSGGAPVPGGGGGGGGGGSTAEPFWHDLMDARRSMWRRVPGAEYPDGYLGTITSRRGDRVLDAVKGRVNQRQYQRGVHKGERIDPGDYFWPNAFNPMTALRLESQGRKFAPIGMAPPVLSREEVFPMRAPEDPGMIDPKRVSQLRSLAPAWRW